MADRAQENGEKSGQSDDTTDAEVMIEHFGDMHVGGGEGGRAAKEKTLEMTAGQSLTAEQLKMMLHAEPGLFRMPFQEKTQEQFKFWSTQPVLRLDEDRKENGPIETGKTPADVRQEPYNLPEGFTWCEVDMRDGQEAKEVYDLLNQNYVEDDDNMFRFDYSPAFLEWALTPPGSQKDFIVGIRVDPSAAAVTKGKSRRKLVGFITGVPVQMRVSDKVMPMVEINFLCVLKKLRSKRLAPVLIKEITRRVNLTGNLSNENIFRCGRPFTRRALSFPGPLLDAGIRPMTPADVPSARKLLNTYLEAFKLAPVMDDADLAHWLLPRPNVVDSFVVTKEGCVTDMCSFYHLHSTVIDNTAYPSLNAVYSFYNVATTMSLTSLMREALILAKQRDVDVFNALDLMENQLFLKELKFGHGDGVLHYYLYNWGCADIEPAHVGLVLL
ncbi:hypothetical protein NSK_001592 [Nannochloropsis salina CCMP1776]|uniref:Glycylpeptide N-tetradecanoyltransferase n=1 Tax=Nannochloropsis salina CCMP1776 TaxID=1027361 RepID=A0A4D9D761_9STRA|nr:hypothetical protein NSK_001592 [Nannochloropsis salina CCMP1776]|eukprot:TFJ87260.1 hypothetical protein NSK_001592 [Nannochloropsis salina CCMP1776]